MAGRAAITGRASERGTCETRRVLRSRRPGFAGARASLGHSEVSQKRPGHRQFRPRAQSGRLGTWRDEQNSLTTTDDFDKVWTFYKEKFQLAKPDSGAFTQRFDNDVTEKAITVKVFDDIQAHALVGPKSDLVTASGFTVHSLRYQLVGFVYRPKGADRTCILLAYRPNTEFIALLKDRLAKE